MLIREFENRARFPPSGLAGGRDGKASRFVIRYGEDDAEETPPSGRFALNAGERFLLEPAAGGGYGAPSDRDKSAIERDIAEGYVSKQAAARDYHR